MNIPKMLLKRLYTYSSLENTPGGVVFSVKNRLSDASLIRVNALIIDNQAVTVEDFYLVSGDGVKYTIEEITPENPLDFPLRKQIKFHINMDHLMPGMHTLEIHFTADPFGELDFSVEDSITSETKPLVRVPRDQYNDYSTDIINQRQEFIHKFSGFNPDHLTRYSFDPQLVKGNVENFTGIAQVPIGIAGPLQINGEFASGEFLIPMATTEGTLVASYNRGMKLLNLNGGVTCTVTGDVMQRAPVFVFSDARQGREFAQWIEENFSEIRRMANATSTIADLIEIDSYQANKFVYLRFNFTTGDAAGQNMVGRATFAACSWIIDQFPGIEHFYLESNFATDKKASQINIMRTRGKRVTAEAIIKRNTLIEHMRVEPETLVYHYGVGNIGSILSGANNNGLHSANAITAMFIATGQDVANVAESSAGILYSELTPEKDFYISITIPSLIVATYGGGTSLATQNECLQILGSYGKGKVNKLAEIIAGTVLAGELSLASAISSTDWVSSHEVYGRNR